MYIVNYTREDGETRGYLINSVSNARKCARLLRQNGCKVNYIKNNKNKQKLTKIY